MILTETTLRIIAIGNAFDVQGHLRKIALIVCLESTLSSNRTLPLQIQCVLA